MYFEQTISKKADLLILTVIFSLLELRIKNDFFCYSPFPPIFICQLQCNANSKSGFKENLLANLLKIITAVIQYPTNKSVQWRVIYLLLQGFLHHSDHGLLMNSRLKTI